MDKYKRYRKRHPERIKAYNKRTQLHRHLKHKYGISKEQYEALLASQDGVCALCKKECDVKRRLSVDHVHDETKRVRGLLCHYCNAGLGSFKDSIVLLARAIEYLRHDVDPVDTE